MEYAFRRAGLACQKFQGDRHKKQKYAKIGWPPRLSVQNNRLDTRHFGGRLQGVADRCVEQRGYNDIVYEKGACAHLIPNDETGPGAVDAGVPEFIDRQLEGAFGHAARWYTQGPFISAAPEFGYQGKATPREVYRAGIAATDSHCIKNFGGKRFADCNVSIQDQVLKDVESGHIAFDNVAGKTFFMWLLQNTKEGYLADPIHGGTKDMGAWKMIGFPGCLLYTSDA